MRITRGQLGRIIREEARRLQEAGIPIKQAREMYGDDDAPSPRGKPVGRRMQHASKAQAFADQLHAFFQSVKWGQDFAEDQSVDVFGSLEPFQSMESDELVQHLMSEKPVQVALEQFLTYFIQAAAEAEGA